MHRLEFIAEHSLCELIQLLCIVVSNAADVAAFKSFTPGAAAPTPGAAAAKPTSAPSAPSPAPAPAPGKTYPSHLPG